MSIFFKNDSVPSCETLCAELTHCKFEFELVSFKFDSELTVQSKQFSENSNISKFSLKVKQHFTYNAYHMAVTCEFSILTKIRVTIYVIAGHNWSTLRFLNFFKIDKKKDVLMQQTDSISRSDLIHEQKYTPEMIVRGYKL